MNGLKKSKVNLYLVDDHPIVREGIRSSLQTCDWIDVVGEAATGEEMLSGLAFDTRIDIILLDMGLSDGLGSDFVARVKDSRPNIRILIYSMYDNLDYLKRAIQSGVDGYLLKDAGPKELLIGIGEVMKGNRYFSTKASSRWIEGLIEGDLRPEHKITGESSSKDHKIDLTPREKEVLILVAQGLTSKKISERLNLNIRTVETHRRNLMLKLSVHSSNGLTQYAIAHGYVKLRTG